MPNKDEKKHEYEFNVLLGIFQQLIQSVKENDGQWQTLEDLMDARADIAIRHAFDGFNMSYDEAFDLLKKTDDLTDEQRAKRDILVAAVDNLVDFSVAQEYQMICDLLDFDKMSNDDEYDDEYDFDLWLDIFKKYNYNYVWVENMDIEYAMIMASYLYNIKNDTVLMYMTQGDERVRPWHLQYEGFTAPKSSFPAWLIPPIEHRCRCYLIEDSVSSSLHNVQNSVIDIPTMPEWFNPTFKESVALGGRIFSDEHPYFQIDLEHLSMLTDISERIKKKYFK